jgi:hypothetical protein
MKEPPSRLAPTGSIGWPNGSLTTSGEGLPSYQYCHSASRMYFFAVEETGL